MGGNERGEAVGEGGPLKHRSVARSAEVVPRVDRLGAFELFVVPITTIASGAFRPISVSVDQSTASGTFGNTIRYIPPSNPLSNSASGTMLFTGYPVATTVDRSKLATTLAEHFDAGETTARIVARQAGDLHDSRQLAYDLDMEVTVESVVAHLEDAPDDHSLIDRWNWWLGALELSHGGYERFKVRPDLA